MQICLLLLAICFSTSVIARPIWEPDNNYALANSLRYATVRIECQSTNSAGVGTGVFFAFAETNGLVVPAIVTCKHVVRQAQTGKLVFTVQSMTNDDVEERVTLLISNFSELWQLHPSNDVDLAAMPLAPLIMDLKKREKKIKMMAITPDMCPSSQKNVDQGPLMPVTMVGYPIGLSDLYNNLPLVRRGITASTPANNFNGKREFVIDAACFPGSSGSPVFLYEEGFYRERENAYLGTKLVFLGVLWGGPQYNSADGTYAITAIPTNMDPNRSTMIPINLGYVTRYDVVMELDQLFRTGRPENFVTKEGMAFYYDGRK